MSKNKPKIYLAAPFFNAEQVALVDQLEALVLDLGFELFSPRKGENAVEMNRMLSNIREYHKLNEINPTQAKMETGELLPPPPGPSDELRRAVFRDNWENIDDADLVVAVIDNFDVGVMWELGYAYARHVPVVTHTAHNYGCNLMLAHSIIGHTKSLSELSLVLEIAMPRISFEQKTEEWGAAIAEIQARFKSKFALVEGPSERSQS